MQLRVDRLCYLFEGLEVGEVDAVVVVDLGIYVSVEFVGDIELHWYIGFELQLADPFGFVVYMVLCLLCNFMLWWLDAFGIESYIVVESTYFSGIYVVVCNGFGVVPLAVGVDGLRWIEDGLLVELLHVWLWLVLNELQFALV